jgi:hypothetical protein
LSFWADAGHLDEALYELRRLIVAPKLFGCAANATGIALKPALISELANGRDEFHFARGRVSFYRTEP